jgi:hypothetical protein
MSKIRRALAHLLGWHAPESVLRDGSGNELARALGPKRDCPMCASRFWL